MTVYYDKDGVYVADGRLKFGNRVLPTTSSNRGGDTILAGAGFNGVEIKRSGLFSPTFQVVISYYHPADKPDEVVWSTKNEQDALQIADAIKRVLG